MVDIFLKRRYKMRVSLYSVRLPPARDRVLPLLTFFDDSGHGVKEFLVFLM